MPRYIVLVSILMALTLISCAGAPHSYTISNIEKVYLGSGEVTFLILGNNDTLVPKTYYGPSEGLVFKRDVPSGSKMWAQLIWETESGRDVRLRTVITHIHDLNDLNPGSWNHGKFGRGQIHEVE